jgi:hypothetical protein
MATTSGKGGVSPIGRALQKHSARPGTAFPGATGNAAANTRLGATYLDEILTGNPAVTTTTHPIFGDVTKVRLPDGRGVWFRQNGELIGLLERYTP